MEDKLKKNHMEDILKFLVNGRRPQYFGKWNTTSIFWQMVDDHNILANGRQHQSFDNGRQPQKYGKWKTTSIFWQSEDDINGRQTHFFQLEDDLNFLIGKAELASPSLS